MVEATLGAGGSIGARSKPRSRRWRRRSAPTTTRSPRPAAPPARRRRSCCEFGAEFEARKAVLGVELELLRVRRQGGRSAQTLRAGIEAERDAQLARTMRDFGEGPLISGTDRAAVPGDYVYLGPRTVVETGVTPEIVDAYRENTRGPACAACSRPRTRACRPAIENAESLMTTKFETAAAGAAAVVPAAGHAGGAAEGGRGRGSGCRCRERGLDARGRGARDLCRWRPRSRNRDRGEPAGAFRSAEDAVGEFVRTGKADVAGLVTSMIADMARLGARKFLLGPVATALSGALGGGAGEALASVFHTGGPQAGGAGAATAGGLPRRAADACRRHRGRWGRTQPGLAADEVPAILQRGERVLSRDEARAWLRFRAASPSRSWRATRKASASRAPRSPPISPVRSPRDDAACEGAPEVTAARDRRAGAPSTARQARKHGEV